MDRKWYIIFVSKVDLICMYISMDGYVDKWRDDKREKERQPHIKTNRIIKLR